MLCNSAMTYPDGIEEKVDIKYKKGHFVVDIMYLFMYNQ